MGRCRVGLGSGRGREKSYPQAVDKLSTGYAQGVDKLCTGYPQKCFFSWCQTTRRTTRQIVLEFLENFNYSKTSFEELRHAKKHAEHVPKNHLQCRIPLRISVHYIYTENVGINEKKWG